MKITKETIEYVAGLARLEFSEEQKEKLMLDMGNILTNVDKLNELDTLGVEPTAHVIPVSNVFREDKVCASYDREKILYNAATTEDGCFKVPKVME